LGEDDDWQHDQIFRLIVQVELSSLDQRAKQGIIERPLYGLDQEDEKYPPTDPANQNDPARKQRSGRKINCVLRGPENNGPDEYREQVVFSVGSMEIGTRF